MSSFTKCQSSGATDKGHRFTEDLKETEWVRTVCFLLNVWQSVLNCSSLPPDLGFVHIWSATLLISTLCFKEEKNP